MRRFPEKKYIHTYRKVFEYSLVLQVAALIAVLFGFGVTWRQVIVFAGCSIASLAIGIWLPLKRGETLIQKLLIIFLSPTNYTFFVCIRIGIMWIQMKALLWGGMENIPW